MRELRLIIENPELKKDLENELEKDLENFESIVPEHFDRIEISNFKRSYLNLWTEVPELDEENKK